MPSLIQRFSLICALALACGVSALANDSILSLDKRFEAYTVPDTADGVGARLYLRVAGSSEAGVLLCRNDRWIAAQWSPDSRFLAVTDHVDGHISDVSIYRVSTATSPEGLAYELRYRSPEPGTYDTKWEVAGWNIEKEVAFVVRSTLHDEKRFRVPLDHAVDSK